MMSIGWKPETQMESCLLSKSPLRLLLLEDSPADAELILSSLKRAGYALSFDVVTMLEELREKVRAIEYDLIISDHSLGNWNGFEALGELRNLGKNVPFIVVTGSLGDETAVEYIKRGAADYVLKHRLNLLPLA